MSNSIHTTNLLIKLRHPIPESVVMDIAKTEEFANDFFLSLDNFGENSLVVSLVSYDTTKEKTYESKRDLFISSIYPNCEYLSITMDSLSAERLAAVGPQIYELERDLRALIELVFLRKKGANWAKSFIKQSGYQRVGEHADRADKIVEKLSNPLDNHNFVALKDFFKESINVKENSLTQILEDISMQLEKLRSIHGEDGLERHLPGLVKSIHDLKVAYKTTKSSDLYEFTDYTISDQIGELYDLRNLWAHNTCLFTAHEFREFRSKFDKVQRYVHTLLTIYGYASRGAVTRELIKRSNILMLMFDSKTHDEPNFRISLRLENQGAHVIYYEKDNVTYKDVYEFLSTVSSYLETLPETSYVALKRYPSLSILSNISDVLNEGVRSLDTEKFDELCSKLRDIGYADLSDAEPDIVKDRDEFLNRIFSSVTPELQSS